MFDTMNLTKAFASLCAGLLVLLLGGWAAEGLYGIDHHGDDHVRGYVVLEDEGMDDVAVADAESQVGSGRCRDAHVGIAQRGGKTCLVRCEYCEIGFQYRALVDRVHDLHRRR
jgi:hypothetical protein